MNESQMFGMVLADKLRHTIFRPEQKLITWTLHISSLLFHLLKIDLVITVRSLEIKEST